MIPDHYATLGVEPTAKATAIRAAYLALMREYHPDRNRDPAAADRAQAIIAAFQVLGDFDRRNHYDWDRRREREAAAAAAAARPRRIRAGVVAAGAVGLAAAGAWVLTPAPPLEPDRRGTNVAAPRTPVADVTNEARRNTDVKRVADAPAVKAEAIREAPAQVSDPPAAIRLVEAEPSRVAPKIERPPRVRVATVEPTPGPKADRPKVERAPTSRVAVAGPVAKASAAPRPAAKVTAQPPPKQPAKPLAKPVRQASKPPSSTTTDLASLDRFVMSFYGQSWRYGDAPRRTALEQTRAGFVVRRGSCLAEPCKRAAYLKLMRDVSEIVGTGQPKAR